MTDHTKIKICNIYKIFGSQPEQHLERVKSGLSKGDLLSQDGAVLGINNVSLDIAAGKTSVIMGLSGSGKSTLIRHINRLIEPTSGEIFVNGENILTFDEKRLLDFRRRQISMVFQKFALLPHKSVLENVMYPLLISGTDKKTASEAARRQIELVGLDGFEKKFPFQLSGGMQQRVGLARALATDADILLMDEAFSALDPLIRNDMQLQLKELQARLNKTIVFITHDLDEALLLGDQIAILKDGELRQCGTKSSILLSPADDYVRRFVRDVNRARVVDIGSVAEACQIIDGEPPSNYSGLSVPDGITALLYKNGQSLKVISRHHIQTGAKPSEAVMRDGNLMLEDVIADFASSVEYVAVTSEAGHIMGVMTQHCLLRSLVQKERHSAPRAE